MPRTMKVGNRPAGTTRAALGIASTTGARASTPAEASAAVVSGRGRAPVRCPARPSAPSSSGCQRLVERGEGTLRAPR
jgi:hypothetical protein